MNSEITKAIINAKIEVHAGQARRLMQHSLVGEFNHHVNCVNELQQELQKAIEEEEAAKVKSETPPAEGQAETAPAKQRKKK